VDRYEDGGPGPGQYKQLSFAENLKAKIFASFDRSRSLESEKGSQPETKRILPKKVNPPGPGNYDTHVSDFDRPKTGAKMGKAERTGIMNKDEAHKPGPCYLPKVEAQKKRNAKWSLAVSGRGNASPGDHKQVMSTTSHPSKSAMKHYEPGPGQYDITEAVNKLKKSPAYGMGRKRKSQLSNHYFPGPMEYEVNVDHSRKHYPAHKMGSAN
jgi:hypothetical protein